MTDCELIDLAFGVRYPKGCPDAFRIGAETMQAHALRMWLRMEQRSTKAMRGSIPEAFGRACREIKARSDPEQWMMNNGAYWCANRLELTLLMRRKGNDE